VHKQREKIAQSSHLVTLEEIIREGTAIYINNWRPLFNKSQKCGEEGKHQYRCRPLDPEILNFGASEDPGVNIR
jgi:hypothetical protein